MQELRFAVILGILLAASAFGQARRTFDTPEEAAEAVVKAAEQNDAATLAEVFGANARGILTTGNPKQDQQERAEFAKLAHSKHQLEKDALNQNRMILCIGSENWPFPVPIVKTAGKWSFDPAQGSMEMRARRIGANELDAIEICAAYAQAQEEYAAKIRDKHGMLEYAQRLMGGPAAGDALYVEGNPENLVPKSFAEAEGGAKPKPYHGYYFRILKAQGPNAPGGAHNFLVKDSMIGGFGLIASPAQYGVSGVHSFILNQDGVIYEKDLRGQSSPVTRFDPDKSWKRVD